jgi:hypothetical protein
MGHPLWREGWSVIYLYNCFWTLPEQSLLGQSRTELTTMFRCLIWDSLNLGRQVPVFISPRNRVAQIYPRALGSLSIASYDSQGYRGGILSRLHTRNRLTYWLNILIVSLRGHHRKHNSPLAAMLLPWKHPWPVDSEVTAYAPSWLRKDTVVLKIFGMSTDIRTRNQ